MGSVRRGDRPQGIRRGQRRGAECVAARWWAVAGSGYSRDGMKAPRYAHWLLVPTLALGVAAGPVRAHAAPAKPAGEGETAPTQEGQAAKGKAAKGKAGGAPKLESGEAQDDEAAPAAGASALPGAAPEAETTPASDADAPPSAEAAPEAGTAPEAEPSEPALEPAVTVQPRPVEPAVETSTVSAGTASREVVADPRRVRSDDRILFRAGILSLGVAAAAVVPTVIGFQQAYVAHQDDDPARERTMRGLGIGAGVAAGTYAITGAVLMALGARQRRAVVAPVAGAGQLGAVLRARF
jgi:hypothetical protein